MFSNTIDERIIAVIFCLMFFTAGIIWATINPIWEGFDEPAHYAYIQHIAENGNLPTSKDYFSEEIYQSLLILPLGNSLRGGFERVSGEDAKSYEEFWNNVNIKNYQNDYNLLINSENTRSIENTSGFKIWEAQQAPLYYLLMTPFYKLFEDYDIMNIVFLIRYVGITLATVGIYFVYKTTRMFTENKFIVYGVLIFVSLNPMIITNFARLSNETLTFLLFTLLFFYIAKFLKEKPTSKTIIILGIIISLGLMTRQSFFSVLPLIPLVTIFKVHQSSFELKAKIVNILKNNLMIFSIMLTGSWWYLKNYQSTGNFTGIGFLSSSTLDFGKVLLLDWPMYFYIVFNNFWAIFGWSFIKLPTPFYNLFLILTLISIVGLVYLVIKKFNNRKILKSWKFQLMVFFSFTILIMILGMAYVNFKHYLIDGREFIFTGGWYLIDIITPISVLLFLGYKTLLDKLKKNYSVIIPSFFLIMTVYSLSVFLYVSSYYYDLR